MTTELKLYPYQTEDVQWLLQHPKCILGSEMGTGKTIEVLMLCKSVEAENVLVVCPKSLIAEWQFQIEQWLGKEWLDKFVIFNYEKLLNSQLTSMLIQTPWDLICFDETHKLKNPKAKRTKAAFLLSNHSRLILASGTPMQNGPQDLWSLLHLVAPASYSNYNLFLNEYCIIQQLPKPPFPRIIVGAKNKEQLREQLGRYMLRREKRDVLKDLPSKTFRTIPVQLDDEQWEKYKSMENELFVLLDSGEKITAPAAMAQLIRLRQICLEPNLLSEEHKISSPSTKTKLILDLLDSATNPVIIFTYFERYATLLSQELHKARIACALYTGQQTAEERAIKVREFQGNKYKVMIGTITSMGLGLTLTAADTAIFADWWYNPAVNDQAIDRLHRIGQTHPVTIVDLWAKGTIEDAMHRTMNRKRVMFNSIVANEATIEELREMREARNAAH